MHTRAITIFTTILIFCTVNFAQTISIDLDNTAGIQSTFTSNDTAVTIGIAIRLSGVSQISSYQFKVSFDTSRFTYIGAQQDFGITGEKNILTKNSGSIIGIAQLQLNPPARDTVEFSYTITGTTASTLVSGDGLAGVLYLKSKVPLGDSSSIMVSNCILADFDLSQTSVSVYNKGTYSVLPVTGSIDQHSYNTKTSSRQTRTLRLLIQNNSVQFDLPVSALRNNKLFAVTLYTLSGKHLTEYNFTTSNIDFYTCENNNTLLNQSGRFLCCLKTSTGNYSQVITFR